MIITKQIIPVVISTKKLKRLEISGNDIYVSCGIPLPALVKKAAQQNLSLETLTGIPGSVGGALYGNSGSKPEGVIRSIGDYVYKVTSVSTTGSLMTKKRSDIAFSYRNSDLQSEFIVEAHLKANFEDSSILLERWRSIFKNKFAAQPYNAKSAGCIFKNTTQKAAWQLIQEVGLASARKGDIFVSPKHANFILNGGAGTADDFKYLINLIQKRVQDEFGIALVLEVQIW